MPEPEDTQEYLARAAAEREQARREAEESEAWRDGITGDPDAPLGYIVDPNHRPDPAHMGSVDTSGTSYRSEYDLKAHTGIFDGGKAIGQRAADTGHAPVATLPVSEDLHPAIAASLEGYVPPSPEPPPPAGATDYLADPSQVGEPTEAEVTEARIPEGLMADPTPGALLGNQPTVPPAAGDTNYGPDPTHGGDAESGVTEVNEEEGNEMRPTPEELVGQGGEPTGDQAPPEGSQEATGERPAEPGPGDPTQPPPGTQEDQGGPPPETRIVTQADAGGSVST